MVKIKNKTRLIAMLGITVLGIMSAATLQADPPDVRNELNYVYVHGYSFNQIRGLQLRACQGQKECDYWDLGQAKSNVTHVGWWASMPYPYYGVPRMLEVLNDTCKGDDRCVVVCHSTGCPITGYVIDRYGSRYNIQYVSAQASAEGGTELAALGTAAVVLFPALGTMLGAPGSYELLPGVARSRYNHYNNRGVPTYTTTGIKTGFSTAFQNGVISGRDDTVVGSASSCGYSRAYAVNQNNCPYKINRYVWKKKWKYKKIWRKKIWYPVWYRKWVGVKKYPARYNNHIEKGVDHSGTVSTEYQKMMK